MSSPAEPRAPIGWIERALRDDGHRYVIGVDEVGRGPLAGPVVVAAVALRLDDVSWCDVLDDSKRLKEAARLEADARVRRHAPSWALAWMDVDEIARRNILHASLEGMRRAVEDVRRSLGEVRDTLVLVDGNRPVPGLDGAQRTVVKGDAASWAIAAASCVAKVARDAYMVELDRRWPGYGFTGHKGYPTPAHRGALMRLGPTPEHRRAFGPVKAAIAQHALPGFDPDA